MSIPRPPPFVRESFRVPVGGSSEEVGWGGRLSKWQWALAIGVPVAVAAGLAGLTLLVRRRRAREKERSPPPSMSPTPVASPASTTVHKTESAGGKVTAQEVKQRGNTLFKQGKLEEAAQCYEEAIQLGAAGGDVTLLASCHQNLAAVHDELVKKSTDADQKKHHSQLVIENCDKAITLDRRYVKALLRRFKMHQALGHMEEALLDVTRVLLLDESHAQSLSTSVTTLLKDLSVADAAKTFPTLGPLTPTKYLVKTYTESYIWKDDISEERLRVLWLEAHPPTVDAPDSVDVSQDQTHVEATQETVPTNSGERGEGRVVDGEGGEGGAGGSGEEGQVLDGAVENKSQEEEGGEEGGEGGDAVEEDRVGEEGENEVKGEVKVKGEEGKAEEGEEEGGAGGEKVQENGELVDQTADHMAGFGEDPFVQAAAKFSRYELTGILELLTQAINTGHEVFKVHAQLLRGTLHALWRMEDEALRDLQAVINTQGQPSQMYVNALIKRAGIFAGQQNMDKCKTCLEKALAVCPDSIDVLVHRARVCLESEEMSNLDSVVEDLTKAVERAPQQPYPIYSLASSFHRLASISQSMQLIQTARIKFQEALRKFPTFADGLILYALFLQDTGEFQQAEEVLNKVVQVEPDNPLGYFSLGLLHLVVRSDIDQTMIHMQKAIAVDISCVQAYDTIASIEMQRGHTARAMELYEKAVHYSRNQVEMTQAYVAQKVFSMQDKVCKEYGVSIQQLAARSAASMTPPGAPNM